MTDHRSQRIPYLDILRTVALIAITSTHALNRSFTIFEGAREEYLALPVIASVCKALLYVFNRMGVPLFLMISGALLLPRDYSGQYGRFLKKNWLRLFLTTEIWLALMFWYMQLFPGSFLETEGLKECLLRFAMTLLFLNPLRMSSMWYMEMILCLYLMIPIFSAALRSLSPRVFILPIVLVILHRCLWPDVQNVLSGLEVDRDFTPALTASNLFPVYAVFLLMGCFCAKGCFSRVPTPAVAAIFLGSFLGYAAMQFWMYSLPNNVVLGDVYRSLWLTVSVVSLFELIRRRKHVFPAEERVCRFLSEISFGVYFVHICIMEGLNYLLDLHWAGLRHFGRYALLELVSVAGSVLIIQLLRRIPGVGLYLFGVKPPKAPSAAIPPNGGEKLPV